jgi:hypothetical protein
MYCTVVKVVNILYYSHHLSHTFLLKYFSGIFFIVKSIKKSSLVGNLRFACEYSMSGSVFLKLNIINMKTIKQLLIIGSVFAFGNAGAISPVWHVQEYWYTQDQERVEVKPDDLPEKVKASVGHKTDLAWTILKAYLITNKDQTQYYELFVQKPDGETWMKVDKEGKVLN